MVSSYSVIKGIVSVVEQEAAGRPVAKGMELVNLKEYLQFHDRGLSKTESLGLPMSQDELQQKIVDVDTLLSLLEKIYTTLGSLLASFTALSWDS